MNQSVTLNLPAALYDRLQRMADAAMPADAAEELDRLHLKRQREGLTEVEAQAAAALTRRYERRPFARS